MWTLHTKEISVNFTSALPIEDMFLSIIERFHCKFNIYLLGRGSGTPEKTQKGKQTGQRCTAEKKIAMTI